MSDRFPVPLMRVILLLVFCLASRMAAQVPDSLRGFPVSTTVDSGASAKEASPRTPPTVAAGLGMLPSTGPGVTVVPDSAITFSDFRSPSDQLISSGGVFVIESGEGGFDRLQSVHGLRPGSIAFLADGLLLNNPSTGLVSAMIYPIAFAERLEIAAPGTGFFYGAGGVGGAVNYVSRNMRAVRPVSRIYYSQSSYGYSTLDGALTQDVSRGLNVSLGINHHTYDGRYLNSGLDAWKGRVKVRYDMGNATAYVSDIFTRWNRGMNGGVSPATVDSLVYDRIRAGVVNESATELLVRHDLTAGIAFGSLNDSSDLTTFNLQFGSRKRWYIDEAGGTGSTGTPFRDTRREQSAGFAVTHSRRIGAQRLSAGAEIRSRRLLEDAVVGNRRTTQGGAFARLELQPLSSVIITPGVRVDRVLDQTRVSAGVEGSFRIVPPLLLRASASLSHRFPSFMEAFGIGSVALPLPSNDAERHDLISGGFTAGDSSGTFLSADIFHRSVAGAIALDSAGMPGEPPLRFHRVPDETRSGVSAFARLKAGSILAELNADYLSYGGAGGHRYAPRWSLAGGVYVRDRLVGGHLNLKTGFRGRYFTSYEGGRLSGRFETFIPAGTDVPPAATLDFVLIAGIGDAVIHLIWENLLDREYFMEVLYPVNDRSIRFGITWSFLD